MQSNIFFIKFSNFLKKNVKIFTCAFLDNFFYMRCLVNQKSISWQFEQISSQALTDDSLRLNADHQRNTQSTNPEVHVNFSLFTCYQYFKQNFTYFFSIFHILQRKRKKLKTSPSKKKLTRLTRPSNALVAPRLMLQVSYSSLNFW